VKDFRKALLLGSPVAHSLSPAIHNAAFAATGLKVHYQVREVGVEGLTDAVEGLRDANVVGANVTVPHKQAVLGLVDQLDSTAEMIGAVNTIVNRGGRLWATNTDSLGFSRALRDEEIEIRGRDVVLLGAGGSARAVAHALLRDQACSLLIANRHENRAAELAAELASIYPSQGVRSLALSRLNQEQLAGAGVVVNTTTVGLTDSLAPLEARYLPADATVVDIIYNPPRTRLLRDAERAGLRAVNGLGMLVHQAAAAWELWTGQQAPLNEMWLAARRALGGQDS
jgi:shikimate dehydrogenase